MTVEEFIEEYSWQRAKEIQADMLALSSRRPKQWTFVESNGERIIEHIVYFDGCRFQLKSSKMVSWLRALFLWYEAMRDESMYGFSAAEQLEICWVSVLAQLVDNLWVYEPQGLPQGLCRLVVENEFYDDGLEIFAWLKKLFDAKCESQDIPTEYLYWRCVQGSLLCCIYLIEIALKTGDIIEDTFGAINQLKDYLNQCIIEAEEDDCEPDFSVGGDSFERLTKLIPLIEKSGNSELIRLAYEFARDFYQASRRFTLAEQFNAKLND